MYGLTIVVATLLAVSAAHENALWRTKRQENNDQVIDSIFKIPISALQQSGAAAQALRPENAQAIDSVFKIPITTLEAVGNLVKVTRDRRQESDDAQILRQMARDKVRQQKEQDRLRREQIKAERLQQKQQQQQQGYGKHFHKDPFGLNALTNLLVGHHGLFSSHNGISSLTNSNNRPGGIHGIHGGGILGSHGSHGGHGGQGIHNVGASSSNNKPGHTYEVYENVDEGDSPFSWQAATHAIGSFFGFRPPASQKIQNKIAPQEKRPKKERYPYRTTTFRPKYDQNLKKKTKLLYHSEEEKIANKIAPRSGTITFKD